MIVRYRSWIDCIEFLQQDLSDHAVTRMIQTLKLINSCSKLIYFFTRANNAIIYLLAFLHQLLNCFVSLSFAVNLNHSRQTFFIFWVCISLVTLWYSLLLSRFLCRPVENLSIKKAVYSKTCFLELQIHWQPPSSFKSKWLDLKSGRNSKAI